MPLVAQWFRAFVWTLFFEQIAGGVALRAEFPPLRRASVITVCNLASHPAVWFVFPELGAAWGSSHGLTLLVSEVWAFAIEAWIYWLFLGNGRVKTALITSLVANGASFTLGLGLRALGWV
jgi:hypothetical protein